MTTEAAPAGQPLTLLEGVGPKVAGKLERLGLRSVEDLLLHLPLRYQDRTRVVAIGDLLPGRESLVQGEIGSAEVVHGRRRMLVCRLSDGSGAMTLRFFHFGAGLRNALARGARVQCFGEVRDGFSQAEMVHPEFRRMDSHVPGAMDDCLTPVYPAAEGVSQSLLRGLVSQATDLLAAGRCLPELLPDSVLAELGLPPLHDALRLLHQPPPEQDPVALQDLRHPARRRLAFEELLAHHLSLLRLRRRVRARPAPALSGDGRLLEAYLAGLPFSLTGAQQRVVDEVRQDLSRCEPMLRLVQGDVGSGKTVVAAAAALTAVEAGFQAAVMAPTELLAEQHFRSFDAWLRPLGLQPVWLAGAMKSAERDEALEALAMGRSQVAVGTHALFQKDVTFHNLALAVVDEQHRFGVHQRLALREKGGHACQQAHQLIMTATPIPRTLAMAAYADLDTSVIDELPPGRTPVRTVAMPVTRREEVIRRVRSACGGGRQSYWVCTLVEESDSLQAQAAEDSALQLREALPELRVGLVHGRMKAREKESVMAAFKAGDLHVLVATTVIEVGVDVPNASLMIIENAERLGLAQLHQLRGRVGRGSADSYCVLMYQPPLSDPARSRLEVLRRSCDGFEIARRDLELRGPGEVLGTRQTGLVQMRAADLLRDQDLLPAVQTLAASMGDANLVDALIRRWVPAGFRYGDV